MLKNKLIIKKIRNICILLMAIIIMIGVYTNVRRSRAENVIQIELEVSDKSEALGMQTILVDATETQDGNYLLDLPIAVNGNMVTKYYTSDGQEVLMNDENADRTLTLTETEVADQKIQLQTDYDKKEVTTEDGQVVTLYNKELLEEKEIEQNVIPEETEGTSNDTQTNETMTDETTEKPELDDTVIVTGYMPLDAQVDIEEIDLSTLPEITLPVETQTIQKAYEVSVYQTIRRTIDANGNVIAEEIVTPESATTEEVSSENTNLENIDSENETNSTTENINLENTVEEEKIEYDPSIYNEQLVIKTKNTEANTIATVYGLQEDNQIVVLENTTLEEYVDATFQKNNQSVRYIVATEPQAEQPSANNEIEGEGATDGQEQEATVAPNEIENSEWEVIESNPEILEGKMTVTLKGPSDDLTEDWVTLIVNGEKTESGIRKKVTEKKTLTDGVQYTVEITGIPTDAYQVKVQLEPKTSGMQRLLRTFGLSAESESEDSGIMLLATTYNTLQVIEGSTPASPMPGYSFLDNPFSIKRIDIENVTFVSSLSGMDSSKAWDVSEAKDESIMAWYTGTGPYKVYIGSNSTIYANENSAGLFGYIGYSTICEATETITNINLLNTSNVTNMISMFYYTGYRAMTSLDLGDIDTSNVTNMRAMFYSTGYTEMISLNLGENFDTSQVIDMDNMFYSTGYMAMTSLDLGEKFNTSNVTDMSYMFWCTGYTSMTSLNLGDNFVTSNVTDMSYMFYRTGYTAMTSLDLGDKFDTNKVTGMTNMFNGCGYTEMTVLEMGRAFKKIAGANRAGFAGYLGKAGCIIYCSEDIYSNEHAFKLSATSTETIAYDRGTLNPYKTDNTAPTWNASTSGGTYNQSSKLYTFNLTGTDEMALDGAKSELSASNITVRVNGIAVSASNLTFGSSLSTDGKTKTFQLGIQNYTGGTITISINAGALVDTSGNTSVAKTYTITPDTTAPVWADDISNATFSSSAKTYKFNLVGSDETSLNTTASALTKSSNITITINGTTTTNYTIGTATVSGNRKTFPITLTNFTGGNVKITISAGALQDRAGNTSIAKTYEFSTDGTAPTWANNILNGTYNADAKTYTLNFQGTDDTALAASTLSSSNVTVTADGVRLTNLSFGTVTTSSDNKTKTFPLTINNFPGGNIRITISAGALKDTSGNTSTQKIYEFQVDGVAPTWDANISNGTYNQSAKTYSFNVRGSDDVGLNNTSSVLSTSNMTITVNGTNASFTVGNGTLNDTAKTFPVTINNFTGGTVIVKINAGALVDTAGNKSVAKQYTFAIDATAPVWEEDAKSTSYNSANKQYSFSLVGTDETGLNDSASVLNTSNMTITVDGTKITDWTVGNTTLTGGKSKTFPITINNFPGGTVKVSILAGTLEDTSGNKSAAKEYSFLADITPPEWQEAQGVYNPEDQSYTITVTGTDNDKLDNVASQLTTSNINLTVGGTKVTPTITTTVSTTSIETYTLKWNNHTGGAVSLTINAGALVDASGNTSAQKVYTFGTVDATKPVWNASISGGTYTLANDTDEFGTFTFSLIGSDETGLNDAQSLLDGKLTITTDGVLVSSSDITIGSATLANGKTKTFPITVRNFKGGNVVITISKGALVDTTGNKSDAKSYTLFKDVTRPVWADNVSNTSYNQATKQYSFSLVGSDENKLNATKSVINSSNVSITVGGTTQSNITFGSASTSGNTKTFPITIPNYTGGNVQITIQKGALVDKDGNVSLQKTYTITPDVTAPTWSYENVEFDADSKAYSVELVGRDEKELNTALSTLVTSGTGKNVTVTCGSTTVTPTVTKLSTSSTEVRYRLTVNNYPGGVVTINISEGALIDAGNNKSQAETITLPEKDVIKPTISVQNPEYSSADKTYTFEIVATDNMSIDSTTSSLATSGNGKNVTITCAGGTIQAPTISIKEVTTTQIIYQVMIQNYPSGIVNVAIDAGAIKDTDGNSNNAATLTLPALDVANPYWQDTATVNYNENNKTLTIQVVGKDETSLNDAQSTLTAGGNLLINVGGQEIDYANVTLGTPTISTDQLTKTFPITINNYTGGIVEVSISTGALKDNSGKISDSKSYTFTDVIKPVVTVEETGTYDKATNTYTLTVHGTDDTSITTANLAGKLQVKVDGTTATPTVTLTQDLAQEKTYTVAIPNYLGGKIDMTIAQGALVDGAGNLSNAVNFSITPDVTAPVWTMSNAEFDSTDSTYHTIVIDLTGSDNMSLAESTLSTENISVQFGSAVVDSSNIQIIGPTSSGDGKGGVSYQLKVSGYTGEDITVILSPETLIDDAGNTSVRTTLTTEAILPDSDDDIPTVSNIQYLVDAINTEVVIDFDITDSWYNFADLIESGEYTLTGQNYTTSGWMGGSYTTVDLSSCTIEIEKEIRIENGYHYTIVIKGLQEVLKTGTSWGIGGMVTKYPLLSVKLNANAATDLFDKGNVATDLLKNQEINFSIKDGDASMELIGVRLDEATGAMNIDLKATWTPSSTGWWWGSMGSATSDFTLTEDMITDIQIDGESVVDYFKEQGAGRITISNEPATSTSGGSSGGWWRKLVGWCIKSIYQRDNHHITRF